MFHGAIDGSLLGDSIFTITFESQSVGLDIVEITLDGAAAGVAGPIAWNNIGLRLAPVGASMACSIENTNDFKMLFSPITGFNPGETSRTFLVTASLMSGGAARCR